MLIGASDIARADGPTGKLARFRRQYMNLKIPTLLSFIKTKAHRQDSEAADHDDLSFIRANALADFSLNEPMA